MTCFVVFGFARPQVLAGIGLAHREIAAELAGGEDTPKNRKDYAEDFLRKLIQIELPVPRFGAPAAERLVDAASEFVSEPRRVLAWLPALAGLAFICVVGLGLWSGEKLYSIGEEAWNTAPAASTEPAPKAVIAETKPTPQTPQNHQGTGDKRETASTSYFYPGETALLPHWVWVILLPVLGAAGLAALLAARRPQATVDDDTELFTRALHHWAVAAYEVRQSPREMKRFLNRLRFAAAGRAPDLPDDVLVGLAVLEHAGADPELKDAIKKGASGLRNAIVAQTIIDARSDAAAVSELINQGLDPDELAASGLAPFDPTAAQVETFLALWQGVKVEG